MLQKIPLELVTLIASYLDLKSTSEFAATCHHCYNAVLPLIWQHLTITDTNELSILDKKFQKNPIWSQRAIQYVHTVSLCRRNCNRIFSCRFAASMFGITSSRSEQQEELLSIQPHEQTGSFGQHLLNLFPHVTRLVLDYALALQNFYLVPQPQPPQTILPYAKSFSVVNYESDNAGILYNLLTPFKKIRHLQLQTLPVVSLCDDMDESILTDSDLNTLASLGLKDLTRLELSYLDSTINMDIFINLLKSLPRLRYLQLNWIFPPVKDDYHQLQQLIELHASLYPDKIEKESNILRISFTNRVFISK